MSQVNAPTIDEKITCYSQFDTKQLEIQLLEEKSFQNRNIIRQVIRKKKKEKEVAESNKHPVEYKNETSREIEKLKELLAETPDFFEQCKIRSTILHLQKNEKKNDEDKKENLNLIENLEKNLPKKEVINEKVEKRELKQLVYDEISQNLNVMNTVLKISDSLELIWVMPFKILSSIEYTWRINDKKIDTYQTSRCVGNFDGKKASLKLENLDITDNGLYHLTINSQRLKRKDLKFNIIVNRDKTETSSIIVDEIKVEIEKPKTEATPDSQYDYKPRTIHKNRFNRHKTMMGQEMLEGIKASQNKESLQTNNNIDETPNKTPPIQTGLKRFTRSATSAKDIILMFCKLNTEEYEQYGVCIENLSTSWNDGLAFCALIHHFHPEAFDFSKLNKNDRRYNFDLAFKTAEKYAEIYPLLDIDDMMIMERPDWKCIFTYVQSFYKTFRTHPLNKLKTMPIS